MVKQKLVFQNTAAVAKKKPQQQQTQQTKKIKQTEQSQENGVSNKVVEDQLIEEVSNDIAPNAPENYSSEKMEQVEGPIALLRNYVRVLKKRSPKLKKLEEDVSSFFA
jgi:hypothetical protein